MKVISYDELNDGGGARTRDALRLTSDATCSKQRQHIEKRRVNKKNMQRGRHDKWCLLLLKELTSCSDLTRLHVVAKIITAIKYIDRTYEVASINTHKSSQITYNNRI